ncbi:MAG: hypothetical protein JST84_04875 [Acidobacteria bacterium]|nr:hypothetical protein [Acidobacteriota bacterium]
MYRDANDVKTIYQLAIALLVLSLVLAVSLFFNAVLYLRRPDRIVVDKSSGKVEMINDRTFGATASTAMTPDRPGKDDKIYLAKVFAEALYKIDPQTRAKDIERALKMMVPSSATVFGKYLKESGVLETQRAESWQSVWEVLDVSIDQADPYLVRLDGRQKITKLVNRMVKEETKTVKLQIKVVADPKGRTDENQHLGFLIQKYEYKDLE